MNLNPAQKPLNFAIVGCGLIGKKRSGTIKAPHRVLWVADVALSRAQSLAVTVEGAEATEDWRMAVTDPRVDAVVVSTTNVALFEVALEAIRAGKHVLLEKPAGRTLEEVATLQSESSRRNVSVRVGFNHRYHPALQKAHELVESGVVGPLMFVRGRYGHGGRVGYDREWRADPALSGGGELIDQGVHLIDLSHWFLGEFFHVQGHATTSFWDMSVDDNAFLNLRTASEQTAWLHVSCTEWKNLFSFEIYGRDGKLHIDGLGGSYGVERLAFYKMLPQMGPPDTQIWEYPMGDNSWQIEMSHFIEDVQQNRIPNPGLAEATAVMSIVEDIYRQSYALNLLPKPL